MAATTKNEFKNDELNAMAEGIMMGYGKYTPGNDRAEYYVGYILRTLAASGVGDADVSGHDVITEALRFCDEGSIIRAVTTCRVGDDFCINLAIETPEDVDFRVGDEMGVLSYVYNVSVPWCSELGYCGYEVAVVGNHRLKLRRVW